MVTCCVAYNRESIEESDTVTFETDEGTAWWKCDDPAIQERKLSDMTGKAEAL